MSSSSTSDPNNPNNPHKPIVTGYPAAAPPPAPATAYPYPAPAPHAPPPQPYYYSNHHNGAATFYVSQPPPPPFSPSDSARLLLRRLLYVCILFFLVFGLITFILWLVLRPRLPDVSLSSASLSRFNLSSNSLSADFLFNLSLHNPSSKMGIVYDSVTAAVLYGEDTLAETSLPPFYQPKGDVRSVAARLVAEGEYVDQGVVDGIEGGRRSSGGEVRFDFRLLALVRFRSGAWGTRRHVLRVYCDDVSFGLKNSTGTMLGSARKCLVHL